MTSKSDFTTEEWQLLLEAPPGAGMIVVTAQRGGSFRETIAMAKAYVEARQQHGESQLLDEIVAAKPQRDHTHYHSPAELKDHELQHLREWSRCSSARRRRQRSMTIARSSSRWPTRSRLPTGSTGKRSARPSRRRSVTSRRLWAQPRGRRRGAPDSPRQPWVRGAAERTSRTTQRSCCARGAWPRTGRHRHAAGARMRSHRARSTSTPRSSRSPVRA